MRSRSGTRIGQWRSRHIAANCSCNAAYSASCAADARPAPRASPPRRALLAFVRGMAMRAAVGDNRASNALRDEGAHVFVAPPQNFGEHAAERWVRGRPGLPGRARPQRPNSASAFARAGSARDVAWNKRAQWRGSGRRHAGRFGDRVRGRCVALPRLAALRWRGAARRGRADHYARTNRRGHADRPRGGVVEIPRGETSPSASSRPDRQPASGRRCASAHVAVGAWRGVAHTALSTRARRRSRRAAARRPQVDRPAHPCASNQTPRGARTSTTMRVRRSPAGRRLRVVPPPSALGAWSRLRISATHTGRRATRRPMRMMRRIVVRRRARARARAEARTRPRAGASPSAPRAAAQSAHAEHLKHGRDQRHQWVTRAPRARIDARGDASRIAKRPRCVASVRASSASPRAASPNAASPTHGVLWHRVGPAAATRRARRSALIVGATRPSLLLRTPSPARVKGRGHGASAAATPARRREPAACGRRRGPRSTSSACLRRCRASAAVGTGRFGNARSAPSPHAALPTPTRASKARWLPCGPRGAASG